ncbi:MAG: hypothetical protein ACRC5M_00450 [Anaeroplasmataceae bacterium]
MKLLRTEQLNDIHTIAKTIYDVSVAYNNGINDNSIHAVTLKLDIVIEKICNIVTMVKKSWLPKNGAVYGMYIVLLGEMLSFAFFLKYTINPDMDFTDEDNELIESFKFATKKDIMTLMGVEFNTSNTMISKKDYAECIRISTKEIIRALAQSVEENMWYKDMNWINENIVLTTTNILKKLKSNEDNTLFGTTFIVKIFMPAYSAKILKIISHYDTWEEVFARTICVSYTAYHKTLSLLLNRKIEELSAHCHDEIAKLALDVVGKHRFENAGIPQVCQDSFMTLKRINDTLPPHIITSSIKSNADATVIAKNICSDITSIINICADQENAFNNNMNSVIKVTDISLRTIGAATAIGLVAFVIFKQTKKTNRRR